MHYRLVFTIFTLVLILLTVGASCEAVELQDYEALQVPVTLDIKGETLDVACGQIGRASGLDIRVAERVRDHRAIIFVDDMPLCELMGHMEKVWGFVWKHKENAQGGDMFYIDADDDEYKKMQEDLEKAREQDRMALMQELDAKIDL